MTRKETIICPCIWIDDGIEHTQCERDNQPINIKTGWVYYGVDYWQIIINMRRNKKASYINFKTGKISKIIEGRFTNLHKFIESPLVDRYIKVG